MLAEHVPAAEPTGGPLEPDEDDVAILDAYSAAVSCAAPTRPTSSLPGRSR